MEFLHAAVAGGRAALLAALPPYVHEHDAELEEQPLLDYGVVAPLAQQFQPGGSQAAAGGGGGMPPAPPLVGMPVPM